MVDKIEILIKNGVIQETNILIIPEEKTCHINGKKLNITEKTVDIILSILATWKYEYGNSEDIDIQEFKVIVYSNNTKTMYHGKGRFPNNYYEFLKILGGIQDEN